MLELLARLKALRDFLTNPAIPDGVDRAADFLHSLADTIRSLQGNLVFAADDGAALDECDALLTECHAGATAVGASSVPVGIDPATILALIALAREVIEWIRKRRNPS